MAIFGFLTTQQPLVVNLHIIFSSFKVRSPGGTCIFYKDLAFKALENHLCCILLVKQVISAVEDPEENESLLVDKEYLCIGRERIEGVFSAIYHT